MNAHFHKLNGVISLFLFYIMFIYRFSAFDSLNFARNNNNNLVFPFKLFCIYHQFIIYLYCGARLNRWNALYIYENKIGKSHCLKPSIKKKLSMFFSLHLPLRPEPYFTMKSKLNIDATDEKVAAIAVATIKTNVWKTSRIVFIVIETRR